MITKYCPVCGDYVKTYESCSCDVNPLLNMPTKREEMLDVKVAVTGHRPHKLWGYDLEHPNYVELREILASQLIQLCATSTVTGMALGVDTVFALAVLDLKKGVMPYLNLECAIPCVGHSSKWFGESVRQYKEILSQADNVTLVSDRQYTPDCMQKRNEYMVDSSDVLIAIWDGTSGGTANCVRYAKSKGMHIVQINPKDIGR